MHSVRSGGCAILKKTPKIGESAANQPISELVIFVNTRPFPEHSSSIAAFSAERPCSSSHLCHIGHVGGPGTSPRKKGDINSISLNICMKKLKKSPKAFHLHPNSRNCVSWRKKPSVGKTLSVSSEKRKANDNEKRPVWTCQFYHRCTVKLPTYKHDSDS